MNRLDAELLGPLAAHGPFKTAIVAVGFFRVAGPVHDQFAFPEAIFHAAVGFGRGVAHAVAVMVHGAPVPAFPAVRVDDHLGMADGVHEAEIGAQVIADVAPGVVRAVAAQDGAVAVFPFYPLDFPGDDVQGLVPTDAFVSRDAALLAVARPVRVEIHAFHGIQQAVPGIDQRLGCQPMGAEGGLARRREGPAPGRHGPGRRVLAVKVNGGHPDDFIVFHIYKNRAAVGVVGIANAAIVHFCAEFPPHGLQHAEGFGKPGACLLRPFQVHPEHLGGVDEGLVVMGKHKQPDGGFGGLEHHAGARPRVNAGGRCYFAAIEPVVPAHGLVAYLDLRNEILLFEPVAVGGLHQRREPDQHIYGKQDAGEDQAVKRISEWLHETIKVMSGRVTTTVLFKKHKVFLGASFHYFRTL